MCKKPIVALDVDKMCKEISEQTGIGLEVVTKIIDTETEYLINHGIAAMQINKYFDFMKNMV